jgi:sporulation protein YlmC with PRC-barrel domain
MKGIKTCTVMLALTSLLLNTVAFAAKDERADIYRVSKVIGADVENPQGEKLGDIRDIVLDPATGRIRYAVMGAGGFLGLGEKYFAIPWTALSSKAGEKGDFILNVEKEKLKNAPGFDKDNWPNMADRSWAEQVHAYYGVKPDWEQAATMRESSATTTQRMADGPVITATVQNVDQSAKLLRVQTAKNEIIELQAPASLLSQLQAGDRIEAVIHKQGGGVPSGSAPASK